MKVHTKRVWPCGNIIETCACGIALPFSAQVKCVTVEFLQRQPTKPMTKVKQKKLAAIDCVFWCLSCNQQSQWQRIQRPDAAKMELMASVASFPALVSEDVASQTTLHLQCLDLHLPLLQQAKSLAALQSWSPHTCSSQNIHKVLVLDAMWHSTWHCWQWCPQENLEGHSWQHFSLWQHTLCLLLLCWIHEPCNWLFFLDCINCTLTVSACADRSSIAFHCLSSHAWAAQCELIVLWHHDTLFFKFHIFHEHLCTPTRKVTSKTSSTGFFHSEVIRSLSELCKFFNWFGQNWQVKLVWLLLLFHCHPQPWLAKWFLQTGSRCSCNCRGDSSTCPLACGSFVSCCAVTRVANEKGLGSFA